MCRKLTVTCFLWHYVIKLKIYFLMLLFCTVVWSLNESLFPYFIKIFVSRLEGWGHNHSNFYVYYLSLPFIGIIGVWVLSEISMQFFHFISIHTYYKISNLIRIELFDRINNYSVQFYRNNQIGTVTSRISDIPLSAKIILQRVLHPILSTLIALAVSLILVSSVSFLFTSLLLIWSCMYLILSVVCNKKSKKVIIKHYLSLSDLNGFIADVFSNYLQVKIFNNSCYENERFQVIQGKEMEDAITEGYYLLRISIIKSVFRSAFIFCTFFLLLRGWIQGWVDIGDFLLVAIANYNLMNHVCSVSAALLEVSKEFGKLEGALNFILLNEIGTHHRHNNYLVKKEGEIVVKDLTFSFANNKKLFEDISFSISPGEKVGIIGKVGSGKSTFVELLLGLHIPEKGRIFVNGVDAYKVNLDVIGYVPQDTILFNRSIMENIRYGRISATDEEVMRAANLADCSDFVDQLENGYNTLVGERGLKLSGGQRQKITIARVILRNPSLYIFDELTSAQDSGSQSHLMKQINRIIKGKTAIFISHDLKFLHKVDRILKFENGKIIENVLANEEKASYNYGMFN